jgi:hypothetical protein
MRFLLVHGTAPGAGKGWWRRSKSADIGPMPSVCRATRPIPRRAATVTLEDYVRAIGAALRADGGRITQ